MCLSVFVKKRDAYHIQQIATNTRALDKVGFGFKGGVTVSFTLYDMSFSFLNCHLQSGAFKAPGRLQMASDVLRQISCNDKDMIEPDAVHDFNFFMGDLNFRFNRTFTVHYPDVKLSPELFHEYD